MATATATAAELKEELQAAERAAAEQAEEESTVEEEEMAKVVEDGLARAARLKLSVAALYNRLRLLPWIWTRRLICRNARLLRFRAEMRHCGRQDRPKRRGSLRRAPIRCRRSKLQSRIGRA